MQSTVDARANKQRMMILIAWPICGILLGIWFSSLSGCNDHIDVNCDEKCRKAIDGCNLFAGFIAFAVACFLMAVPIRCLHVMTKRQKLIPARYKTFAFITDDGHSVIKDEIKEYFGRFHFLDHEVLSSDEIMRKPLDGTRSVFATVADSRWAIRDFNSDDAIAKLHDACPPGLWVRHWFASHPSDDILVCVGKPSDIVRELIGQRGGVVIQIAKTELRMPSVNDIASTSVVANNKMSVDAVIEYNGTEWDLRNQLKKLLDRMYANV